MRAVVAALGLLAGCLEAPPAFDDGLAPDEPAEFRRRITIEADTVGAALTDFPVLVRLASDDGFRAHASDDGLDLAFRDGEGRLLAFERGPWDPALGDLVAWVKLPLVAADRATDFFLHYGGEASEDLSDPSAVWSNGFAVVWHLDTSLDEIIDSTANAVDPQEATGNPVSAEGYVGRAVEMDGSGDLISFGTDLPTGVDAGPELTVAAWARYDSLDIWSQFVGKAPTANNSYGWAIGIDNGYDFLVRTMNGSVNARGWSDDAQPEPGVWYHWVLVFDGGQIGDAARLRGFRDGVEQALVFDGPIPAAFDALGGPLYIGCAPWNLSYCIDGAVDEVHVSAVARSAEWIAAEHANQVEGSTFLTIGEEEAL